MVQGGDDTDSDDPALAPVVRFANEMLKAAIADGASDLHLEPTPEGLLPRYRIDGSLQSRRLLPIELSLPLISRFKVLANIDITEQRLPQDGRFRAKYGTRTFDFRVSTLPNLHGEKIVMRLLDHSSLVTDLSKLGFSKADEKRFGSMLNRSHGMILVTGPTGSGKNHHALRGARRFARRNQKRHHRRRPGRIRTARRHPRPAFTRKSA